MSEVEDIRAATREAHEAIKDLRAATREALDVLAQVKIAARRAVNEGMGEAVTEGLAEFHKANTEAIDEAESRIYQRFAAIGDILMGEDRKTKSAGSAINVLVQQWVAERT